MTPKAFHALFARIGVWAKMPFPVHPHMLRHGCGYAFANAGHDTRALQAWLGHKNIQHTVKYTEIFGLLAWLGSGHSPNSKTRRPRKRQQ
jgi:site-specific recombinase XerD